MCAEHLCVHVCLHVHGYMCVMIYICLWVNMHIVCRDANLTLVTFYLFLSLSVLFIEAKSITEPEDS